MELLLWEKWFVTFIILDAHKTGPAKLSFLVYLSSSLSFSLSLTPSVFPTLSLPFAHLIKHSLSCVCTFEVSAPKDPLFSLCTVLYFCEVWNALCLFSLSLSLSLSLSHPLFIHFPTCPISKHEYLWQKATKTKFVSPTFFCKGQIKQLVKTHRDERHERSHSIWRGSEDMAETDGTS